MSEAERNKEWETEERRIYRNLAATMLSFSVKAKHRTGSLASLCHGDCGNVVVHGKVCHECWSRISTALTEKAERE